MEKLFLALGFTAFAKHRSKAVTLYRQGDINFIIHRGDGKDGGDQEQEADEGGAAAEGVNRQAVQGRERHRPDIAVVGGEVRRALNQVDQQQQSQRDAHRRQGAHVDAVQTLDLRMP